MHLPSPPRPFAGIRDAKNKADCEKAGGVWVEKDNKCGVKKQ